MTLSQLEYAIVLRQFGNFNKAADKLSISQPGLSSQIQKLEEECGIRLFDRSKSPIKPTPDGEAFLQKAEEIVIRANRLKSFTRNLSVTFEGTLKIGIIPTLAPFLVPLFVDELQEDFPKFGLDISEMITEKTIEGVKSGYLDIGIISTPIKTYGIHAIPLFYEKFYFYTSKKSSPGSDIRLEDINYDQLWLLEEGNCFRDQVNNFCNLSEIRKNRSFIYRSNSIDALVRLVDVKGGMTILPELTTLSLSPEQEENIVTIEGPPKAREISLIVSSGEESGRFVTKLAEYIQKNIPKPMLSSEGLEIVDPGIEIT